MKRLLSGILSALLLAGLPLFAQQEKPAAAAPPAATPPLVRPDTDGKVWGALIYATADAAQLTGVKQADPGRLDDLEARLARVFPWKHYEIIGQHTQDVFREYESWVVPSADLFLKVDSKGPGTGGGIHLHLQFWRQEQVLLKTDALLRPKSPLFISGPKWRDGQLIFVLLLTEGGGAE